MGFMEATRGESCPLGQRRGPATPGEDSLIPGFKILPYLYNSNNPGTKTQIPWFDTAWQGVGIPTQLAGCLLAEAH